MQEFNVKKVLIISDTHGRFQYFEPKLEKMDDIDMIIHLGDFGNEKEYIEAVADCPVLFVRGNCDIDAYDVSDEEIFKLGKYKVLATHGHYYGVKSSLERLYQRAKEEECDIVMFGHTHNRLVDLSEDVIMLNPSSVAYSFANEEREFIILEFDENGDVHCH